MKKIDQKNILSATGSMFMTLAICHSASIYASDIDIYSNATGGQTRIMFVLDTSASMTASFAKYACDAPVADSALTVSSTTERSGTTPSYNRSFCTANVTEKNYKYLTQVTAATTTTTTTTTSSASAPPVLKWCSSTEAGTTTSDTACTNPTVRAAAPTGSFCPPKTVTSSPVVNGNVSKQTVTDYYYTRNGGTSNCSNTSSRAYRYRSEVVTTTTTTTTTATPVTTSTSNCTAGTTTSGNTSTVTTCASEIRSCPTGATTSTGCNTVVASAPSGSTGNESCGTGCTAYFTSTTTNRKFYDRITRLKDGMFAVLQGTGGVTSLGNSVVAGLTRFTGGTSGSNPRTGVVLMAARRLDATATECIGGITQRACMLEKISTMDAPDYTPTGKAYAIGAKSLLTTMGTDTSTCNGNGIYFLTDGGPSATTVGDPETEMSNTVSGFSCPSAWDSTISNTNSTYEFKAKTASSDNEKVWRCIAKFTNTLLAGSTNRGQIKTAVVGFGKFFEGLDAYTGAQKNQVGPLTSSNTDIANILSRFSNISNSYGETTGGASRADIANTALWGTYGRGGWYSASEPEEIAQSILNFVSDVAPTFNPIATGSPTLPQDALNPLTIQPYGYYASFVPKPQETTQPLWTGNLNKYRVRYGELYDSTSDTIRLIVDGELNTAASGFWAGGVTGKFPLGLTTNSENVQTANRKIYTNREIATTSPYAATEASSLKAVNVTTLFGTGSTALFANDPDKNYWLNLLGYNVGATETGVTLASLAAKPELRQLGAVMHSTPILLTQRGKITVNASGELDTTDRDDYLLFGTTQGLLHVIDEDSGIEKFTFVPHEMMTRQKTGFLSEASRTGTPLYYGIDAPWTAFTQYTSKTDGTLTVKSSDRTSDGSSDTNLLLKGKQWVYGGLRMGGRSYYALDLTDLETPSLKFHINPDATMTTNATTGAIEINTSNALSYMGQSWSKPTLAYVKFGGVKKLVMFVGGGYDAGYENAAYNQATNVGAGVYMFDANDGSLLWWSSANATALKGAEAYTDASASTINMKYSVVSQINAIDRDNDGLVDNLYFGDLGGQAFRVDLNNQATTKATFATRAVRLFSENVTTGASPRFYEMPSVSIHDGDNGYIAAVALSSGNRSSPLVGTPVANGNQAGSLVSAADGVFVVYDKDVAKSNLYSTSPAPSLSTQNISLTSLNTNISTGVSVASNNGWKYTYSTNAGAYKGMNELYALDNMLYVNVYDRDGVGIGGDCGAGVKGDSYVYQFCLPTGKCGFSTTVATEPNRVKVGAGILGSGLGQQLGGNIRLVVERPETLDCTALLNKNKPECQQFSTTAKIRQLRWYETR